MASDLTWEDCGCFPTCAFAALGDAELVGESAWLRSGGLPYLHVRPDGLGVLYGKAECDGLPIELGSKGGHVVATRMEFTNDVAEVESAGTGRWVTRGLMRIGSHGAVAFDDHDSDPELVPLPLPAGWYLAQVFEHDGDHLGIRLVADVRP